MENKKKVGGKKGVKIGHTRGKVTKSKIAPTIEEIDDESASEFEWMRRPGEGREAFEAFGIYRNLGPKRNHPKVSEELGKHLSLIERWSKHWEWSKRTLAFDYWCDQVALKAVEDEIDQIARQHLSVSRRLLYIGMRKLSEMDDSDISSLSLGESIKAVKTSVEISRLALSDLYAGSSDMALSKEGDSGVVINVENVPEGEIAERHRRVLELSRELRGDKRGK